MRTGIYALLFLLSACSSDQPKESDQLLVDYKNKQLEKAKQVEEQMNQRVEDLNTQLEQIEEDKPKEDEPN